MEFAAALYELQTCVARHIQIRYENVDWFVFKSIKSLISIFGLDDGVPFGAQRVAVDLANRRVVFRQEKGYSHCLPVPRRTLMRPSPFIVSKPERLNRIVVFVGLDVFVGDRNLAIVATVIESGAHFFLFFRNYEL